ncbi:hypothetical protein GGS24DRAFT_496213 [Hypoxylon argillaceum]|nr:hypothetical protein GGS24DRAFT_496213 [Hypoxylon argillaceum]
MASVENVTPNEVVVRNVDEKLDSFLKTLDWMEEHIRQWAGPDPDVSELMGALHIVVAEFHKVNKDLGTALKKSKAMNEELGVSIEKSNAMNEELAATRRELSTYKRELSTYRRDCAEVIRELCAGYKQCKDLLGALDKTRANMSRDIDTMAGSHREMNQAVASLQSIEITPVRNQLSAIQAVDLRNLSEVAKEIGQVVLDLYADILDGLDKTAEYQAAEGRSYNESVTTLAAENSGLISQLQIARGETDEVRRRVDAQSEKLIALEREKSELMAQLKVAKGEADEARKNLAARDKDLSALAREKSRLLDQLVISRGETDEVRENLAALEAQHQELLARSAASPSSATADDPARVREAADMAERVSMLERLASRLGKQLRNERRQSKYMAQLRQATIEVAERKIISQHRRLLEYYPAAPLDMNLEPARPDRPQQAELSAWECLILDVSRDMAFVEMTHIALNVDQSELGALLWKVVTRPGEQQEDKLWRRVRGTTWCCLRQIAMLGEPCDERPCGCLSGHCIQIRRDPAKEKAFCIQQV